MTKSNAINAAKLDELFSDETNIFADAYAAVEASEAATRRIAKTNFESETLAEGANALNSEAAAAVSGEADFASADDSLIFITEHYDEYVALLSASSTEPSTVLEVESGASAAIGGQGVTVNAPSFVSPASVASEALLAALENLRAEKALEALTETTAPLAEAEPEPLLTSYLSGGDAATSFNIEATFVGTWTAALQTDVIKVLDYLSSLITSDLPDVVINGAVVDDVRISFDSTSQLSDDPGLLAADGPGGVLGVGGPQAVRESNGLTAEGFVAVDAEDAVLLQELGVFDSLILHETLHVLGFGSLWESMGLTAGSADTEDLVFTGVNAAAAYAAEFGGTGFVPLEYYGSAATEGKHWNEDLFQNELMTGYLDQDATLSAMSIASLEDLGYETLWDAANAADPGLIFA